MVGFSIRTPYGLSMVTESFPPDRPAAGPSGGTPNGPLGGPSSGSPGAAPTAPTTPGAAPAPSRRGRRTIIIGAVIIIVSLIVGIAATVVVGASMGRPLYEAFTNKTLTTPVDTELTLRQGRYTIFELTGQEGDRGSTTTWDPNGMPPIDIADVRITGPDGTKVATTSLGSSSTASGYDLSSEEINRNGRVFTGIVRFVTPAAGEYHVQIDAPENAEVLIAPGFGSGMRAALGWLGAGFLSGLTFVVGVIVLITGVVRRRRRPIAQPVWGGNLPVKGWYPAPDAAGRQRYWDGQSWTEYLR